MNVRKFVEILNLNELTLFLKQFTLLLIPCSFGTTLDFLLDFFLPFDERHLGDHQLEQHVEEDPREVRFRRPKPVAALRRNQRTNFGRVDRPILEKKNHVIK